MQIPDSYANDSYLMQLSCDILNRFVDDLAFTPTLIKVCVFAYERVFAYQLSFVFEKILFGNMVTMVRECKLNKRNLFS